MNFNDTGTKVILIIVVVFVGLAITGAVLWSSQSAATPAAVAVNVKDVKTDGEPYVGQASAPITIVEWFDYQCPLCKELETNALPEIMTNYVDTGKVKIVFKDMAFLGPDSVTAGEYEYAIWKLYPNLYFTWRTAMFAAQDAEDQGFGNAPSIDKLDATIPGIDAAAVTADVKANASAYDALITADRNEGENTFGVTGTPTVIVGTTSIQGVHPYADYKAAIDPLLQ